MLWECPAAEPHDQWHLSASYVTLHPNMFETQMEPYSWMLIYPKPAQGDESPINIVLPSFPPRAHTVPSMRISYARFDLDLTTSTALNVSWSWFHLWLRLDHWLVNIQTISIPGVAVAQQASSSAQITNMADATNLQDMQAVVTVEDQLFIPQEPTISNEALEPLPIGVAVSPACNPWTITACSCGPPGARSSRTSHANKP